MILGLILIFLTVAFSFSQTSPQRVENINDNLYSFLCKNVFERQKQKDSVVLDLNSPLKRVSIFLYLSDQFYLGSFDEFEIYLGISPSNSLTNLKKYFKASIQQKEKLKTIKIISEFNKSSNSRKIGYKKLLETDIEDNYLKRRTSFYKCPLSRCLDEKLNIELHGFDIHKNPLDTSEIIFDKYGLVKKKLNNDTKNSNHFLVDTLPILNADLSASDPGVSVYKANLVSSDIINNFYLVRFKSGEDTVIGWICACAVKPEPYFVNYDSLELVNINYLSTVDERYLKYDFMRRIKNQKWYKDCFPEMYNLENHVDIILSYAIHLNFKESIPLYNEAIKLSPLNDKAYRYLGASKVGVGDYFGAIQAFTKSIEINPKDEIAYERRGESKIKLKDLRGALLDFQKILEINSINANAYFSIANIKYDLGNYDIAINYYTKFINILQKEKGHEEDYNLKHAYYNRGLAKINVKLKNEGCLDFSRAGELGQEKAYQAIKDYCND